MAMKGVFLTYSLQNTENRGRNAPAELPRIAAEISGLRGVSLAALVAQTSANARAVFGDF